MLFNVNFWILWIVYVYVNVKGNCIFCILGDEGLFGLIFIFINIGIIGIILFIVVYEFVDLLMVILLVFLLLNLI